MCGIFGVVLGPDPAIDSELAGSLVERLFRFSESRGREAAGLAVRSGDSIDVLKQAGSATDFIKSARYREVMQRALERRQSPNNGAGPRALAITGHSRLVTNGLQSSPENNQPVVAGGAVGIHNGIIVNDRELWTRHPDLVRRSEVDTEVLVQLLRKHFDRTRDIVAATRLTFGEIFGSASVALFLEDLESLLLATNTGSLFLVANERQTFVAFASERFILQRLVESPRFTEVVGPCEIQQVRAGNGLLVALSDLKRESFNSLGSSVSAAAPAAESKVPATPKEPGRNGHAPSARRVGIVDHTRGVHDLRRCTRCILTETYPFVEFDAQGVCSYCRNWRKIEVKGEEALLRAVEPYRSKDGSPDVIVAFSGGRDSSYGLHYVKQRLGMNPVAFTYDWGMVTDLARRNQARICGKLGIEHIVRSANIATKRRYIRKNIEAWLKKPELGMVTLFTAGDKEFYHHARMLRHETGIKLVIFCTGNMIEDTPYKTGLCGIREKDHGMTLTGLHVSDEMRLLWYYARNYLTNPSYFNESFKDTLNAYWQTFVVKDDFLYLYHYLKWDEQEIVGTIRREYDWEVAPDTTSTWRIGDWTAAFYNYIYLTIAGWTEDEVMLSNMVREGVHTRERALELAAEYRKPRLPTLQEYAQAVGFNCEEALNIINSAKKLY
jgi:glucosamine--fructose-6-phosphate aminotransferase (isomerizing)